MQRPNQIMNVNKTFTSIFLRILNTIGFIQLRMVIMSKIISVIGHTVWAWHVNYWSKVLKTPKMMIVILLCDCILHSTAHTLQHLVGLSDFFYTARLYYQGEKTDCYISWEFAVIVVLFALFRLYVLLSRWTTVKRRIHLLCVHYFPQITFVHTEYVVFIVFFFC